MIGLRVFLRFIAALSAWAGAILALLGDWEPATFAIANACLGHLLADWFERAERAA